MRIIQQKGKKQGCEGKGGTLEASRSISSPDLIRTLSLQSNNEKVKGRAMMHSVNTVVSNIHTKNTHRAKHSKKIKK